jgi:hypothetical protein
MALVALDVRIETNVPLCGEHLCGTFVIGGSSGPQAVVSAGTARTLGWAADVQGQGKLDTAPLVLRRGLGVEVRGEAGVVSPLNQKLVLGLQVAGQATLKARVILRFIEPTTPVDVVIPAIEQEVFVLAQTSPESWLLVSTSEESVTLPAVEEEEWHLAPTGVRQG